jgi:hypothetical protein
MILREDVSALTYELAMWRDNPAGRNNDDADYMRGLLEAILTSKD